MSDLAIAFATPWFSIEAIPGDPGEEPYYVLRGADGVIILPVTEDGRFVLVRQYRHARGRMSLEFPAGQIDDGETPEQAARRELLEETGFTAAKMIPLGRGGLALNRDSTSQHLFLARGVRSMPDARPEHGMDNVILTVDELRGRVLAGEFEQMAALGVILLATWHNQLALPPLPTEVSR